MILFDILMYIEGYAYLPLTIDHAIDHEINRYSIDCRPQSIFNVQIRFMCEEETWITVSTYSPILIPWYDCLVSSIEPVSDNTIGIWLKTERYLMSKYPDYVKIKEQDDN